VLSRDGIYKKAGVGRYSQRVKDQEEYKKKLIKMHRVRRALRYARRPIGYSKDVAVRSLKAKFIPTCKKERQRVRKDYLQFRNSPTGQGHYKRMAHDQVYRRIQIEKKMLHPGKRFKLALCR
jgi:hypothetical protein